MGNDDWSSVSRARMAMIQQEFAKQRGIRGGGGCMGIRVRRRRRKNKSKSSRWRL